VIAIAAGASHSLALTKGGRVLAWGCGDYENYGQCRVPAAAKSRVFAIAAGHYHGLALKLGS
jgi:alpha-tubulin suppressor-like RCC1 family protein